MSVNYAMYDDINEVKKNFINSDYPFFLITDSKGEVLHKNDEDNSVESAADQIANFFNAIRKGSTMIFVIKHFKKIPSGGLKKNSDPDCISSYKRKENYSDAEREAYRGENPRMYDLMNEIRQMRQEIRDMKLSQDIDDDSEDDETIAGSAQPGGWLGALLGNPGIQTALTNLLTNITANLVTPTIQTMSNQTIQKPQTLAGTDPGQQISLEQILEELFKKGVTIEDLYKLSQMTPQKIATLKTFL